MKSKKAFTLLETIVYIAVLFVVITVIISFLSWSMNSNTKTAAMREVSDNATRVMEIMAYEIRESEGIYLPTTTSTQLSLQTSKHLPQGEELSYIDFYATSGNLYLKKESQSPISLISEKVEVESLFFNLVSTTTTYPSVQIGLKINYKNPNNRPEYSAQVAVTSTVSVRSY
jgi:type II secretory pathway pseudopilin PulG